MAATERRHNLYAYLSQTLLTVSTHAHTHTAQHLHALLCLFVHLINLLLVMLLQLGTLQLEGWGHEVIVHCTDTVEAIVAECGA